MADLKTDYKDDILDTSQNTRRKYQMVDNGDGTVSFVDVTEYIQQGDSFGADDTNATNTKVNALESDIDEINDKLTCQTYTPSTSNLNLAQSIDAYISDNPMDLYETRRVVITTTQSTARHYVIDITKTKNGQDDAYTGFALQAGTATSRFNFYKLGNTTRVYSLTPNGGMLKEVTSGSGVTFANALSQIYTVYNALSATEKQNCTLRYSNYIMNLVQQSDGRFSCIYITSDNKIRVYDFNLNYSKAITVEGTTARDMSSDTLNAGIQLYCFNQESYTPS